jgi:hypothetical protein
LKLRKADVRQSQGLFILQHPGRKTLKMANGGVKQVSGAWVDYEVDTLPGSSGSPVFDNRWELVALHSRAGTDGSTRGSPSRPSWTTCRPPSRPCWGEAASRPTPFWPAGTGPLGQS